MNTLGHARINHVALPSGDIAQSVHFFQAFGLKPGFSKLDESGQVALQQMTDGTCFVELILTQGDASTSDWHLGLRVDDLAPAIAALADHGILPVGPARRGQSGVDYVFFADPFGNRVEVTAMPS